MPSSISRVLFDRTSSSSCTGCGYWTVPSQEKDDASHQTANSRCGRGSGAIFPIIIIINNKMLKKKTPSLDNKLWYCHIPPQVWSSAKLLVWRLGVGYDELTEEATYNKDKSAVLGGPEQPGRTVTKP